MHAQEFGIGGFTLGPKGEGAQTSQFWPSFVEEYSKLRFMYSKYGKTCVILNASVDCYNNSMSSASFPSPTRGFFARPNWGRGKAAPDSRQMT